MQLDARLLVVDCMCLSTFNIQSIIAVFNNSLMLIAIYIEAEFPLYYHAPSMSSFSQERREIGKESSKFP